MPLDPEGFAAEAARRPGRVALVFGDERTGLGRAELARCHALTRIPTDARQPSLNVSQALCAYAFALSLDPRRAPGPGRGRPTMPSFAGSRRCSTTSCGPSDSSGGGGPAWAP